MAADASAASDYFLFGKKVLAVVVAQVLECARFESWDGLGLSELVSIYSCWALNFF